MGCKNTKAVVTRDTTSCDGGSVIGIGGGCGQGGITILGGYGNTVATQDYEGIYCSEFSEPVTETTEIKM